MANRFRKLDETPMVEEEDLVSHERPWRLRQDLNSGKTKAQSGNRKLEEDAVNKAPDEEKKKKIIEKIRQQAGSGNRKITDEEINEQIRIEEEEEKAKAEKEKQQKTAEAPCEEPEEQKSNAPEPDAKEPKKSAQPKETESPTGKFSLLNAAKMIFGGEILNRKGTIRLLPLFLLIGFSFIITVSNRYTVEKLTKEKIASRDRIDQMREHRIHARSQYQHTIQMSTIAKQLDTICVGIIAEPPYKIEKED